MDTKATQLTNVEKAARVPHPRGLWTLFLTEVWERFSYYGMRALLVLFMVDQVRGGMGLDDPTATAIYGLYTAFVYLAALPGGWMADRLLGAQRAVFLGGIIIALGHFTMAIPATRTFFLGLILVVVGTGLLKPNISAMVGQLYPEGGGRRDAGFTIFYLGINLGAAVGPLICGALGEKVNWHYGFGAAGVGMLFGVGQFWMTRKHLGEAGRVPGHREHLGAAAPKFDRAWWGVGGFVLVLAALVAAGLGGVLPINPILMAKGTTYLIVGLAVAYFAFVFIFGKLDSTERKHVAMIVILFIAAAMFWSGFEQAGSSLNLFAERYTDRVLDWLTIHGAAYEIPASYFQSLNPFFIITLAPIFAALWIRLARRQLNPSIPFKFASGLILLAVGFLVMVWASKRVLAGGQKDGTGVTPVFLILTYLFHTIGEICLSPVGLSSVTKLAPRRFVGQMMGTWFLAASLGNLIAGLLAGQFRADALEEMPGLYMQVVMTSLGTGLLLLIFVRPLRRLLVGVK